MGMAKNTRKRGREQAGMSREGRRTMEKVLENTVRDNYSLLLTSSPIHLSELLISAYPIIYHLINPFMVPLIIYYFHYAQM